MKFSVMGCGRWGSFIAWYLHKIGHEVCIWGRQGSANLAALQQGHMGDFDFPAEIRLTTDAQKQRRLRISLLFPLVRSIFGNLCMARLLAGV